MTNVSAGNTFHYNLGKGGNGGRATGFIPDTVSELREALQNEHPDEEYTDEQIEAMIEQEETDWDGTPNEGSAGTSTSFGSYSTDDNDGYTPAGGVYDPISGNFSALYGNIGIRGGKGGARAVENNGEYFITTDGENVKGDDGTTYYGGTTGQALTAIGGLREANIIAYGGNGAGAAVGIDYETHPAINGSSDQSTSWNVTEDESDGV